MHYRLPTLILPVLFLLLTYHPKLFAQCNSNIAYGQSVTVSSVENDDYSLYDPTHVVDGNMGTRWSSKYTDDQWLYVDLGSPKDICKVVIKWEDAYGEDFDLIYWSGGTWQVYQAVTNNHSTTNTFNLSLNTQYIGFQGHKRATEYGYSIWEFEIYEQGAAGKPDYVPSNMTGPSTASPGSNVVMNLNIANNSGVAGNGGNGKDRYYIGENPGLWGYYQELKNFDTGDLAAWASFNVNSGDLTIPNGLTYGDYYIIFYMDADDYVDESNEGNNVVYHPITIQAQAKPDYVPSNMTGPSTASPGSNVVVNLNIANNSGVAGNAGNGKDRYYFGENPGLWGYYTELKNFDTGDLGPWASFDVNSGDLTIPNGTSPGNYYIIFYMDADDYVDESNEGNNVAYHPITIQAKPDYVPHSLSVTPSTVAPGGSVQANVYAKNNGPGAGTVNSKGKYYYSNDNNLDGSDQVIGTDDIEPLAAGQQTPESEALDIPSSAQPGTRYIIYKVDADDDIHETNENNNWISYPITIQGYPDLVVQNQSISPTSTSAGGSITSYCDVKNIGNGYAGASILGYYLSTNTTYEAGDIFLAQTNVTALNAGASYNANKSLTIPAGTAPGTYYIIFRCDNNDQVTESNEGNNVAYSTLTVTGYPDLVVQNPTVNPATATSGGTTLASATVYNSGAQAAGASILGYYLSTNTTYEAGDIFLAQTNVPALNTGASYNASKSLTIPAGTAPGTYYIVFRCDNNGQVTESNEGNNVAYSTLIVTGYPDLVIQNPTTNPGTTTPGGTTLASATVYNSGSQAAGASTLGYYLSTNTTYEAGDIFLAQTNVPALNTGASYNANKSLTIPAGTAPGQYYIIFKADDLNAVVESNENNNTGYADIEVNGTPDLNPQNASLSITAVYPASQTQASCTVYNIGNGVASASKLGYYLSTNTTYEAGDTYLDVDDVIIINPGGTYNVSKAVTIPAGTTPGNYYILFFADHLNTVTESNETNNVAYAAITVLSPVPPPVADFTASSTSICQGEYVSFTDLSTNNPTSWLWSFSPATVSYINSTSSTSKNPQVQFNSPGTYAVSLTATNIGGSDTKIKTAYITVSGAQVAQVSISPTTPEVCEGEDVVFTATPVNGGANPQYQWKVNGVNVGGNSPVYTLSNPTNGATVSCVMTSSLSCASPAVATSNTASVTVHPLPTVTLASFPTLTTSTPPYALVEGSPAGGTYSGAGVSGGIFDPSIGVGNYTITYTYTNTYGCIGTASGVISVEHPVVAPFTWTPTNLSGLFFGTAKVDGIITQEGLDWIAAFDEAGNCAGAVQILQNGQFALPIYGDDATTVSEDEGINAGEKFYLRLYDASADTYLEYPYIGAPTLFDQWANTNGTPIPAYNDPAVMYDFLTEAPVPFTWSPTNQSGLFIGQAQVDGVPASNTDWIAAFDQSGNCAGAAQIIVAGGIAYINLPIYGDDPTTPGVDEGINAGESFKLVLYDASEGEYLDYPYASNITQFPLWANTNGTPIPAYNNANTVYNFQRITVFTDNIPLKAGWNLISFDVLPQDNSISNIFSGLNAGNLEYVTSFKQGALIYDPNGPPFFNSLTHIEKGYGYWVKVGTDDLLTVVGISIDPTYKNPLKAGWNLVAYIPQSSATPANYFNSLITSNNLVYVTGFDNGTTIFNPNGPPFLNTLNSLNNGKGYWVRVTNDAATYRKEGRNIPTPNYMFIQGQTNIQNVGESIWILDGQGRELAQMEILANGHLKPQPIYGDDPSTDRIEGLKAGEELQFAYKGQIIKPGITFQSEETLKQVDLQFGSETRLHVFPNPSAGQARITYELNREADVSLSVWDALGREITKLHEGKQLDGLHQIDWNASNLPEGFYLIKLMIDGKAVGHTRLILND